MIIDIHGHDTIDMVVYNNNHVLLAWFHKLHVILVNVLDGTFKYINIPDVITMVKAYEDGWIINYTNRVQLYLVNFNFTSQLLLYSNSTQLHQMFMVNDVLYTFYNNHLTTINMISGDIFKIKFYDVWVHQVNQNFIILQYDEYDIYWLDIHDLSVHNIYHSPECYILYGNEDICYILEDDKVYTINSNLNKTLTTIQVKSHCHAIVDNKNYIITLYPDTPERSPYMMIK